MVNNTVNGKKIGKAARPSQQIRVNYYACGKKSERDPMDAMENKKQPSIPIAQFFKKADIISNTPTHLVVRAYLGGNPKKVGKDVGILH